MIERLCRKKRAARSVYLKSDESKSYWYSHSLRLKTLKKFVSINLTMTQRLHTGMLQLLYSQASLPRPFKSPDSP
jgi:hypothetical protein